MRKYHYYISDELEELVQSWVAKQTQGKVPWKITKSSAVEYLIRKAIEDEKLQKPK